MTDEMFEAMAKAYRMGCDEAREICDNYKIRIRKLEAALCEIVELGFFDGDRAMDIARKALEGKNGG
jgi:hypothetical protein